MFKILFSILLAARCCTVSAQDLIVLRNNDSIDAKVLRVNKTEIEFRKTENPDGPIYTLPVYDIQSIRYQNGYEDTFKTVSRHLASGLMQGGYPHYQGEVSAAFGLGIGAASRIADTNRIFLETVHGVRINPFVFAGIGTGVNWFHNLESAGYNGFNEYVEYSGGCAFPFFANAKGYYPVNKYLSAYLSLDLGASVPDGRSVKNGTVQLYTSVGPGISVGTGRSHYQGDIGIRFQYMGKGLNAVLFRLGLGF